MKRKDHSSIKFEVAEALGEWMNCLYLRRDDSGVLTPKFIHHSHADGTSGITQILEGEGHQVHYQTGLKYDNSPSFFQRILLLKEFLKLTKGVKHLWRYQRVDCTGIAPNFSLIFFSKEDTLNLESLALESKVSLNSILLSALDNSVSTHLLKSGSERKWISPLNMRPTKDQEKISGNYSASIILNLPSGPSQPKDIHSKIKTYLKKGLHWGSFLYSNMAALIGKKGTLKVAKSIKEVGTGVFSNLGAWPHEGIELNAKGINPKHRAVLAPATQILPIAATAWNWQGRLSLTLQVHPSLGVPPEMTAAIVYSWTKELGLKLDPEIKELQWQDFPETPKDKIIRHAASVEN